MHMQVKIKMCCVGKREGVGEKPVHVQMMLIAH